MHTKNVFWYLLKVIRDAELAPVYYEKYLQSNEDLDLFGKWAFTHMCSVGLATILDYRLTFYPEEVKKILSIHPSFEQIKDLNSYEEVMLNFKNKTEDILIKEIKVNKINYKNLGFVIDSKDCVIINLFKSYIEKSIV